MGAGQIRTGFSSAALGSCSGGPQGSFPFDHVCMFSVLVRQPMAHLSFHVHFVWTVDVWVLVQGHLEGLGSGLQSGAMATRGVQG